MGASAVMRISRASTTFSKAPPTIALVASATSSHHRSGASTDSMVNRDGSGAAGTAAGVGSGPIVVFHRVPSSARPHTTAGTTRDAPAHVARAKGRAPKATGPQPGRPTSSSRSIPARKASASATGTMAATPRPARPTRLRSKTTPSSPATASRSTSPSTRRVVATSVTIGCR
jgi:hypothetical protein